MGTITFKKLYDKRSVIDIFYGLSNTVFYKYPDNITLYNFYLRLIGMSGDNRTLILYAKPFITLYEGNTSGKPHFYFNGYFLQRDESFDFVFALFSYLKGRLSLSPLKTYPDSRKYWKQSKPGEFNHDILSTPFKKLPQKHKDKIYKTTIQYLVDYAYNEKTTKPSPKSKTHWYSEVILNHCPEPFEKVNKTIGQCYAALTVREPHLCRPVQISLPQN